MPTNSGQLLLTGLLNSVKASYPAGLSDDDFFEFFCSDMASSNFDLDHSQIKSGIIDGSKDGGIDAAYVFVNRQLVTEDYDYKAKEPTDIDLLIVQSKNATSFTESAIDKLSSSLPMLFSSTTKKKLEETFKPELIDIFKSFLKAIDRLAPQFPKITIKIAYCSKAVSPNDAVTAKSESLLTLIKSSFPNQIVSFEFLGAQQLYDLAAKQKKLIKELKITGAPLVGDTENSSFVVLTKLQDYKVFLSDDNSNLMTRIFDANVRAYQGEVDVNREIAKSLTDPSVGVEFWWLNNGITIVGDRVQSLGTGKLTIENPLIVNGLQSSYVIFNSVKSDDERMVLVRVISEANQSKRDEIIRATNRQTNIKASSFRATEKVHQQLEDYLLTVGYFYDRRKNKYKHEGKPADKIISIDRLAQAVLALLLQRPSVARARPATALKQEKEYVQIFPMEPNQHPLEMYGAALILLEFVDNYFKKIATTANQVHRNNLKFHVLMVLGWALNDHKTLPAVRISQLDMTNATEARLKAVTDWVFKQFDKKGASDKIAKDAAFTTMLKKSWRKTSTAVPAA